MSKSFRSLAASFLFSLAFFAVVSARAAWVPSRETTFAGSNGNSWAKAVVADGRGSVYVGGYTYTGSLFAAWIARFDENLNFISSTTISGSQAGGYSDIYSLAVDGAGNVCAAGTLGNSGTGQDFFVKRFTANLAPLPGVYFPDAAADDYAYGVACTPADVYVTGTINSNLVVMRLSAADPTVVKSSTSYVGPGGGRGEGRSIVLDSSGRVFVGGGVSNTSSGGSDLWLGRFTPNIALESFFTLNGPASGYDEISSLAWAPDGSLFAAGLVTVSNSDMWAGRFSPNLALLDSATWDGPGGGVDSLRQIVVDERGNPYVAGFVNGITPVFPGGSDAKRDIYTARLSPSPLRVVSSRTLAGSAANQDEGWGLSLDGKGNLFVSGLLTNGAGANAWLGEFSVAGDILSAPTTDVKNVKVYPSPFRPSQGDSVIAIANLPVGAEVSIHTLAGDLVASLTADDLGGIAWDGRNASGQPVASGVYYGVASGQGGRKTFKVVVER